MYVCVYDEEEIIDSREKKEGNRDKVIQSMRCTLEIMAIQIVNLQN